MEYGKSGQKQQTDGESKENDIGVSVDSSMSLHLLPDNLIMKCLSYLDAPAASRAMGINQFFQAAITRLMIDHEWLRYRPFDHILKLAYRHLKYHRDTQLFEILSKNLLQPGLFIKRSPREQYEISRFVRYGCQHRMVQLGMLTRPSLVDNNSISSPLLVHGILASDKQGSEWFSELGQICCVGQYGYSDPVFCRTPSWNANEDTSTIVVSWCSRMAKILESCTTAAPAAGGNLLSEEGMVSLSSSLADVLWWSGNIIPSALAYERAYSDAMVELFPSHPLSLKIAVNQLALGGELVNRGDGTDRDDNDQQRHELASKLLHSSALAFENSLSEMDCSGCNDEGVQLSLQMHIMKHNIMLLSSLISGEDNTQGEYTIRDTLLRILAPSDRDWYN